MMKRTDEEGATGAIKLSSENTIELQPYWSAFEAAKKEAERLKRIFGVSMTEAEAARQRFWMKVEELYPETIDGDWRMDDREWQLIPKEENNGRPPSLPDFLRDILGGE